MNTPQKAKKELHLTARSLFERLKSEHGAEHAKKMVTMILENAEVWSKLGKELYVGSK